MEWLSIWGEKKNISQYKEFPGITQSLEHNVVYLFPPATMLFLQVSSTSP